MKTVDGRWSMAKIMAGFQCAACGAWNETSVDVSAGRRQQYVEDCQVCCKPNLLRVEYDGEEWRMEAELE